MTKHEEIASALTDEILSQRFRTGERLPSERDLAARFDANRGAVREAMKKVAQMGLATIQPGGARVAPIEQANLDVIGLMLGRGDSPDTGLLVQVLEVMATLAKLATSHVIDFASDEQISDIRGRIQPMLGGKLDVEAYAVARIELMRAIMLASGHLVCQIIARSLFAQLIEAVGEQKPAPVDSTKHHEFHLMLDEALAKRDKHKALHALQALDEFNRASVLMDTDTTQPSHIVEVSL